MLHIYKRPHRCLHPYLQGAVCTIKCLSPAMGFSAACSNVVLLCGSFLFLMFHVYLHYVVLSVP